MVFDFQYRQNEIIARIAQLAEQQPLLSSQLWFHNDIRDNFYYASYLFTASIHHTKVLQLNAEAAKAKATIVLLEILRLQDQNPASKTYGHWPLNLEPSPQLASPHVLPVELMGSLMAYFTVKHEEDFSQPLLEAFNQALTHIYRSDFYRQPMTHFIHHEAKYTAAKIIFGERFGDSVLVEDGRESLQLTLEHVKRYGMSEYSSLPWFWHWLQAFTCAWQLTKDKDLKTQLSEMLDYLWNERAVFYLKGAWVGTHSRGLKHDIPLDGNVLHDYVQFGDFKLPDKMPRTEYAGFLFYQATESALQTAITRSKPTEVNKLITKHAGTANEHRLHSYAYITEDFAAGGMWERCLEFDNEQHRWDISLPVDDEVGINQAYFYHPSEASALHDPRHQSECTEVLFHKNTIVALYQIPDGQYDSIIGILPLTDWQQEPSLLVGQTTKLYWAVHLMQPYQLEATTDRCTVISKGNRNGIVIEVVAKADAERYGYNSYYEFTDAVKRNRPAWSDSDILAVSYKNTENAILQLAIDRNHNSTPTIDGQPIDFTKYYV